MICFTLRIFTKYMWKIVDRMDLLMFWMGWRERKIRYAHTSVHLKRFTQYVSTVKLYIQLNLCRLSFTLALYRSFLLSVLSCAELCCAVSVCLSVYGVSHTLHYAVEWVLCFVCVCMFVDGAGASVCIVSVCFSVSVRVCMCMWRFAFVTCYRLAAVTIRSHKTLNPSSTHTRSVILLSWNCRFDMSRIETLSARE